MTQAATHAATQAAAHAAQETGPAEATGPAQPGLAAPDAAPPLGRVLVLDTHRRRTPPAGPTRSVRPRPARRRLTGLDGLRAVAVLSVVVFHLDLSLAPGGFLGVDVFFVISGFLITNLLATEVLQTGRIRLGRFYLRRARRLLPTVLALLLAVTIAAHTLWRDQLPTLRGGVLSSLSYVTNWWLIADHQDYFVAAGRPSMVQHLWSLAIEEQFYLVWSAVVVVVGGVLLVRRHDDDRPKRLRRVVALAAVLAVAATLAMAVYAKAADLPYGGSTSRVYFGSDTHSAGLFLGAAAGAWWALRRHRDALAPRTRARLVRVSDVIGLVAVGVLVQQVLTVSEFAPRLYRGGFLIFDALVLVVVLCAVRAGSFFGRLIDMRPIRWVGQRSYSIYIWHWPIAVVTRPGLDVPGPVWLVDTGRFALILAVSTLSYRFVELPLRSGQFARSRAARAARRSAGTPAGRWGGPARRGTLVATGIAVVTALAFALIAGPTSPARPPAAVGDTVDRTLGNAVAGVPAVAVPGSSPATRARAAPAPSSRTSATSGPATPGVTHAAAPAAPAKAAAGATLPVSAFGDSVLLGAGPALRARTGRLWLDAVEGRQAQPILGDIAREARAHTVAPYVVIHLGNNGIISPDQLRSTLRALGDRTRVVLLNDRVARDWQDPNNHTIAAVGRAFPNVRLVDWHAIAGRHRSWLYPDGLHLTPAGAAAYTGIVVGALTG